LKNRLFSNSFLFQESNSLENLKEQNMIEYDISPSRDEVAILCNNDAVYLYDLQNSSNFDTLLFQI
jgi:hypothetical protein